jgi:hypothetical protein
MAAASLFVIIFFTWPSLVHRFPGIDALGNSRERGSSLGEAPRKGFSAALRSESACDLTRQVDGSAAPPRFSNAWTRVRGLPPGLGPQATNPRLGSGPRRQTPAWARAPGDKPPPGLGPQATNPRLGSGPRRQTWGGEPSFGGLGLRSAPQARKFRRAHGRYLAPPRSL